MAIKTPKRRTVRPSAKRGAQKSNSSRMGTAKRTKGDAASTTKLDALIAALRKPAGATLAQLIALTGWQMHSIRGAMSGALKKQRSISIVSSKTGAGRVYRIESGK